MLKERLTNGWTWWRLSNAQWSNPLDPAFAQRRGGRWNPPDSYPTLYLNEDRVTARLSLRTFIALWPYEPEDLRSDNGPVLIGATLPRDQRVCDVHTPAGVRAVGLPATFPFNRGGERIGHTPCQRIGQQVKDAALRGVRARSARVAHGAGRELAWFPATSRSVARRVASLPFDDWYWA